VGNRIGAVTLPDGERFASFEYDPAFLRSGIQLSPLQMPLSGAVYRFPGLAVESFHGLRACSLMRCQTNMGTR
jgi:serine/threonine-protein kinase HipA